MWVLDYLDDLDADFRAIYGVGDYMTELDGPRFFRLAFRVGAYQGVMSARIEAERNGSPSGRPLENGEAEPKKYVGSTQAELALAMPGVFDLAKEKM